MTKLNKSSINLQWIEEDLILNETISILSRKLLQMTFKKERREHSLIIIGTFVFKIGFTTSVFSNAWKCQASNQKCGRDLHWIPGVMNGIPLTAWEGLEGVPVRVKGGPKVKAGLVSASHRPMDERDRKSRGISPSWNVMKTYQSYDIPWEIQNPPNSKRPDWNWSRTICFWSLHNKNQSIGIESEYWPLEAPIFATKKQGLNINVQPYLAAYQFYCLTFFQEFLLAGFPG